MKARLLAPCSDTLVFFGASGDLAYKQIFPALHEMTRRCGSRGDADFADRILSALRQQFGGHLERPTDRSKQ